MAYLEDEVNHFLRGVLKTEQHLREVIPWNTGDSHLAVWIPVAMAFAVLCWLCLRFMMGWEHTFSRDGRRSLDAMKARRNIPKSFRSKD